MLFSNSYQGHIKHRLHGKGRSIEKQCLCLPSYLNPQPCSQASWEVSASLFATPRLPGHLVLNISVGGSNVIAPLNMLPVQCLMRLGTGQSKDSYLQAAVLGRCVLLKIRSDDSMKWREFEQEQDHSQANRTLKTSSLLLVSSGYWHFLSVPPSVTNVDQL